MVQAIRRIFVSEVIWLKFLGKLIIHVMPYNIFQVRNFPLQFIQIATKQKHCECYFCNGTIFSTPGLLEAARWAKKWLLKLRVKSLIFSRNGLEKNTSQGLWEGIYVGIPQISLMVKKIKMVFDDLHVFCLWIWYDLWVWLWSECLTMNLIWVMSMALTWMMFKVWLIHILPFACPDLTHNICI